VSNASVPPDGPIGAQSETPVCARHADRPTRLRCIRCDRPACPECLREAAVGSQCVDCVNEGRKTVRRSQTVVGAEQTDGRLVVTPVLVVLNVLAFVVTAAQAGTPFLNQRSAIFQETALQPVLTANGEWWRILTSGFMHVGIWHLVLNMAVLYIAASSVEPELGRLRFTVVYFLALFGGNAAAFYFGNAGGLLAGASGAVFGIMGALIVVWRRKKHDFATVVVVVVINLVSNLFTDSSLLAHLGGFVIGGLLTLAMVKAPRENRNLYQIGAVVAAVVLIAGMFALRANDLMNVVLI
jgi:membrane associated rhomboid family serine protease